MNKEDLEFFRGLLDERKRQIEKNIIDAHNEINGLELSGASDEADFASISADKLVEQAITAQQSKELREISSAISKMNNGTYGACEMCEEKISKERLRIKPHAKYCIVCREIVEKNRKQRNHYGS